MPKSCCTRFRLFPKQTNALLVSSPYTLQHPSFPTLRSLCRAFRDLSCKPSELQLTGRERDMLWDLEFGVKTPKTPLQQSFIMHHLVHVGARPMFIPYVDIHCDDLVKIALVSLQASHRIVNKFDSLQTQLLCGIFSCRHMGLIIFSRCTYEVS